MTAKTAKGNALIAALNELTEDELRHYAVAQLELAESLRAQLGLRNQTHFACNNEQGFDSATISEAVRVANQVSDRVQEVEKVYKEAGE